MNDIIQILVLSSPAIVFVNFAAVLTGSFNSRIGLLGDQWALTISNIAQKKAYLNSPETNIKDNIRKRHEKYLRNLTFNATNIEKHLQLLRTGMYLVLISFMLYIIATMLNVLQIYNIYLVYPATIAIWIGMLMDVVGVLLMFIDLWTSYTNLHNENVFLLKIKKMILEDFKATGQLPPDEGDEQMSELHSHRSKGTEQHDEVNRMVVDNAQFRTEVEQEKNIQNAEVALTTRQLQLSAEKHQIQESNKLSSRSSRPSSSSLSESSSASENRNEESSKNEIESASEAKDGSGSSSESSSQASSLSSDNSKNSSLRDVRTS